MSDLKNIVVVGLGFAGLTSAKAIAAGLPATHRVVVINEFNFAYNPPASLRAATVSGWEDKVTVPLTAVFPKGSRHVVLGGVKVVQLGAKSIKLEKAVEGFGSEIPFEYTVIATGSSYAVPTRIAKGAETEADVWQTLKDFQSQIKAAESILVVGGGATGVEFAAEVASEYKGKKVTLVHSADRLFASKDYKSALGSNLASQLTKKGVKIVFNSKVDPKGLETGKIPKQTFELSDGSSVEADFLFIGHGWKPNSEVVATLDPALINEAGFVRVTPTLQLKSSTGAYDHIFAAGDVNDVPEVKQAAFANFQAAVVAANILSLVKGKKATKEYKAASPMVLVTAGPDGGAGQLFGLYIGAWFAKTMKSKGLMLPMWFKNYNVPVRA